MANSCINTIWVLYNDAHCVQYASADDEGKIRWIFIINFYSSLSISTCYISHELFNIWQNEEILSKITCSVFPNISIITKKFHCIDSTKKNINNLATLLPPHIFHHSENLIEKSFFYY